MNIIVRTQAEWDALPASFDKYQVIEIRSDPNEWIRTNTKQYAHVEAWGSSHVEAWGATSITVQSDCSVISLFAFSVAILMAKAKVKKNSSTATVVNVERPKNVETWADYDGAKTTEEKIVLFKRVSKEFKTQENTQNETTWKIGDKIEITTWYPKSQECGAGKFHACSHAHFCDEFRSEKEDRYIAIEVVKTDTYLWPNGEYPHKIAFRKGLVLHECDRFGKNI